ncbi:MAG TPA: TIGR03013 family XrtA/PEP-CTERM system glycosyltransferase [Vicinamibacterales bacterium]|nr:TIGR03013 family XrtA/PEP-CTERM system glycosyltransferase [Vicinamibacterales bacterium]
MRVFNRHVSTRGLTVFGFETILISSSIVVAAHLHGAFDRAISGLWKVVLVTALCELCFYYNDLYNLTRVHATRDLVVGVLKGTGAAAFALAALTALVPSVLLGNGTFATVVVLLLVAVPLWRVAFTGLTSDPHLEERVLIVGTGILAQTVAREIRMQQDFAYRLVGFISDDGAGRRYVRQYDVLGSAADIDRIRATRHVDRIVVSLTDRRGRLPIEALLRAKLAGVRVEDAVTTYERLAGKILVEDLKPSWLIFSDGFRVSRLRRAVKRVVDLLCALVVFVLSAPAMLLTAIVVRLESPGPILYRQERVGENGRVFTLLKFRSMRIDAEQGTPVWAKDGDERVTRVGRVIRVTRLDELPQLWNVLKGDMSFIGPRPERPFFVQQLAEAVPFYMARHSVRPGLTGWAQVKYRYGSSVEDAVEKLRYDLYYIKHLSLVFDLTILIDTVRVIVSGKGAK